MALNSIAMGGYKTYLASYNFDGALWSLEIAARDEDEARQRLARIAFAKLDGEVKAKIAVPTPSIFNVALAKMRSILRLHDSR